MSAFKIGDVVEWTSQSASYYIKKTGVVEAVVAAGERPSKLSKAPSPGAARDHESYLVRVKGRGLYWPRVSHLAAPRPAPPTPPENER